MRPADDWPPRFSWDAVRVPVHLAWAGLNEPAVEAAAKFYFDPSHPYRPPAWVDLYRNTIAPYPGHAGITAVAQLAARRSGVNAPYRHIPVADAPDYYGASLIIIAGLAGAEQPEAPALVPQPPPRSSQQNAGAVRTVLRYLGFGAGQPAPPAQVAGLSPLARLGGRNGSR
jgi:endoglucanase